MADMRMTIVGSYESIIKAISSCKLKADTYVYIKDEELLGWIDLNKQLHRLGNSVRQISSFPSKGIKNVLYIYKKIPYIWNGNEFEALVNNEDLDYNDLDNKPIINLNGTSENPIFSTDLADGNYLIKGVIVLQNEERITTFLGNHFVVETIENIKYITRISGSSIQKISINIDDNSSTTDEYITTEYLRQNKYITENDLDEILIKITTEEIGKLFTNDN